MALTTDRRTLEASARAVADAVDADAQPGTVKRAGFEAAVGAVPALVTDAASVAAAGALAVAGAIPGAVV